MKRILLAIGSSDIGGGQKLFLTYIKEFLKRGYSVDIILPAGPLVEYVKTYDVKIHVVNLNSLYSLVSIAMIMRRGKFDVVNTFLTKCSLLFALVNIFYRTPLCCTLLNAITHEKLGRIQKHIYPFLYLLIQKMSSGIIVNSEQNRKHFIEVAKMNEKSVKVIYSGIDIEEFSSLHRQKSSNGKYIIGTVGRLSIEKGHIYLIKALGHLKQIDFECLIVGNGPLRSELENYVIKEELHEKVKFLGFQDNIAQIMGQMDVVIMPSLNETFGITIIEAFVLKKVIIASEVGGIPELVKNKITGILCPAKNSLALAKAIEYAYANKQEMEQIANNAFSFAMANFTSAAMAENTLRYYDYICSMKPHINEKKKDSEVFL